MLLGLFCYKVFGVRGSLVRRYSSRLWSWWRRQFLLVLASSSAAGRLNQRVLAGQTIIGFGVLLAVLEGPPLFERLPVPLALPMHSRDVPAKLSTVDSNRMSGESGARHGVLGDVHALRVSRLRGKEKAPA